MIATNQHVVACAARERLLGRLLNDRFGAEYASDPYARGWNAAIEHAQEIVERYLCERADTQPVAAGLRELRDATCIDMRLRAALILGSGSHEHLQRATCDPSLCTPPVVSQDTGTFSPLEIEHSPSLSPGTTPPVRDVGGGFDVGGPV